MPSDGILVAVRVGVENKRTVAPLGLEEKWAHENPWLLTIGPLGLGALALGREWFWLHDRDLTDHLGGR